MKPLKASEIVGNWATLLLCNNKDGTIDYGRLEEEIDVLISSTPNGIYSNGTSGEFHTQNECEFDKVNGLLAKKCENAGIPFQIGVSHMSAQLSLERLRRSVELRPAAMQVILPDWFPPTNDEAISFLETMAKEAGDIGLVLYNPPHAKRVLTPSDWEYLKKRVPSLLGLKVSDQGGDKQWYAEMQKHAADLSVFIPGHNLATGITRGAYGSYSNMACLNPFAAQAWYEQMKNDMSAALELEGRIQQFMKQYIVPLITGYKYSNPACDRFMAVMGVWADVGENMRWPYRSVPKVWVDSIRPEAERLIPEFFNQ